MAATVKQLVSSFEKLWPTNLAEEWDVVGLVSGSSSKTVRTVLLTVDVTKDVVEYAKSISADLILAHHPLMLRGVTSVAEDSSKGSIISELIRADIALYSAHTNADSVDYGTSAVLAKALGLVDSKPLAPISETLGIGQVGSLKNKVSLGELASMLNSILPPTATGVRVAGEFNTQVQKIALCAGAGDSYLEQALDSGADVYITSDLRHHRAQEVLELAKAKGVAFALVDISHWAAEFVWLETAKGQLQSSVPDINFEICDLRTDVFEFLMNKPKDNS
ncbi:MAG: Nif3-like dinuclear metal center hexameric protein [Rhodoluna sp.]